MEETDVLTKMAKASRTGNTSPKQEKKKQVCLKILRQLAEDGHEAAQKPGFAAELQAHFNRLPTRYALDVHVDRAEDVLTHKRLLEEAKVPENRPVFHVRAVQVLPVESQDVPLSPSGHKPLSKSRLAPPVFGSSANLEALAMDFNSKSVVHGEESDGSHHSDGHLQLPMHEVTFSTVDKPKLLSQMSALLADVGLNIREAHVFSTTDGYSLDVFVVDGWPSEDTQNLRRALFSALSAMGKGAWVKASSATVPSSPQPSQNGVQNGTRSSSEPSVDDWEIDISQLKCNKKVASGSFGDLFRGTYCGQDVAIKILKPERLNENLQREFQQEVFIMRKVRHKNVVQFIGACTMPPNLCIITEYMSGGSVYDYLRNQKALLKMPMLLRVAIDVSKGMDYLHQNKIIHRDLKAANLLLDENEVVKVADFGVARVQSQSGVMTAETGTYRWMAPEIIEHKPYGKKADMFSFGVVLWELLTGKVPYADMTPLQAAVGVVQKGLRPTIPKNIPPKLVDLLQRCWKTDPSERPEFSETTLILQEILKEVNEELDNESKQPKDKKLSGLFSSFKRSTVSR
uniref:non-specific serine/threonine protein kinase n=1 Tax=Physcomitrium patens TaxID=3218 RepID=A0A7I4E4F0_PHYPA